MARLKSRNIKDLKFDRDNINQGSEWGMGLLEKSIQEVGLGRSVLTDKNDVLIGGNKTVEKAAALGMSKVIEIETDGTELVVVKRMDLDINTPMGIKAKILDNTVSKINYVEDAAIAEVLCEKAEISEARSYGLVSKGPSDDNSDDHEPVSFSATKRNRITIDLPSKDQLSSCEKEITALLRGKYPDAIITVKGK